MIAIDVVNRTRKITRSLAVVVGVAACAFLITLLVVKGPDRAAVWAGVVAAGAGVVIMIAAIWPLGDQASKPPAQPPISIPQWVVDRPTEVADVVAALLRRETGTVGITTALHGAGGFGKTTVAQMVCTDHRVKRRFKGHMYFVTIGRDVRGSAAIAAKVNEVIKLVAGEDATFTDPEVAGQRLGAYLNSGPRRLLILDDVWEPEQFAAFTDGGRRCARLVTTRIPSLLAGRAVLVRVDQMSLEQARVLLTSGLPPLNPKLVGGLLAVTGQWPLLLRLVNKILANAATAGADMAGATADLLDRLRVKGPAAVDDLSMESRDSLEVSEKQARASAVRATIGASTSLLDPKDAERFAELGVFAEDETIPFSLIAMLWRVTTGLDKLQASQLTARLAELALVGLTDTPGGGIVLHDVVRDFLRDELGLERLKRLNRTLLEAVASDLPLAPPLGVAGPEATTVAWWGMRGGEHYLWDHLIEHLMDADWPAVAERVSGDLRWVGARLQEFGPAAPATDLSLVGTTKAGALRVALERAAHLLAPTEPTEVVVDVLHSRIVDDPDWAAQVLALRDVYPRARLVNCWPPHDLANPALRRVLTGHGAEVNAVVIAPDGSWLTSGGWDGKVRIWDAATGEERAALTSRKRWGYLARFSGLVYVIYPVAIAPDGNWLATVDTDNKVRIWDAATGHERATLTGHTGGVTTVAVAPHGDWLATVGGGVVAIWDAATGQKKVTFTGHSTEADAAAVAPPSSWQATVGNSLAWLRDAFSGKYRPNSVNAVAVASDGSWLATGGGDGTARIWDPATGQKKATIIGHTGGVTAVAIAPDGSWLATAGDDVVRIWDTITWQEQATLHSGGVNTIEIAPDGRWLATVDTDNKVRIWDAATGHERATLSGHTSGVTTVAIAPDGNWLATVGGDLIRIWDAITGRERATLSGHTNAVNAVAIAPDGSWLASASSDRTIRIWDAVSKRQQVALVGRPMRVSAVAIAPGGSWLATVGSDLVRVWDLIARQERITFSGRTQNVSAVAIAPDGSWLATGGSDWHVRIWDAATGQERTMLSNGMGWVHAVAVAPDGSWLATGSGDGTARIWDVATELQRSALPGHTSGVYAVAIAPDGSWLATGGGDGTARIWDTATGQKRATLKGHTSGVYAVAIAPDGSWLATGSGDGTARIWDTATGQKRATLKGHTSGVYAVAIAPDGSWLATGSGDGTARIWDTVSWEAKALMRFENIILSCTWIDAERIALGGPAGLYLLDFIHGNAASSRQQPPQQERLRARSM